MGRRDQLLTVGLAVMTTGALLAIAWWLGASAAGLPKDATLAFVAVFLAGAYLTAACLAGLPPARPDVAVAHEEELRRIAERLNGITGGGTASYGDSREQKVFESHYRDIGVDAFNAALGAERSASQGLQARITEWAAEDFPAEDLWHPGTIAQRARDVLVAQSDEAAAAGGIESKAGGDAEGPMVVWSSNIIWWGHVGQAVSDEGLFEQEQRVRDWFAEVVRCPEARAYREALRATVAARERIGTTLWPVLHHEPVRWARRCPICRPPRARRFS